MKFLSIILIQILKTQKNPIGANLSGFDLFKF